MSENGARRFYDKAERDRQHALRRIQLRRSVSISNWAIVPRVIVAAGTLAAFCLASVGVSDTNSRDGNNCDGSNRNRSHDASRRNSIGNDCSRSTNIVLRPRMR